MTVSNYPPPRNAPTLKEVAALAGVSSGLASMALRGVAGPSESTRKRVLEAAEELQYRGNSAASILARQNPRLIGVTCFLDRDIDADIVDQIYLQSGKNGYEIVIGATTPTHSLERSLHMLTASRCEAIICVGPKTTDGLADIASRTPVFIIGGSAEHREGIYAAHIDHSAAMKLAVNHLIDFGHKNIAHVSGGRGGSSDERQEGYRSAMKEAGLGAYIKIVEGGEDEESGARAAVNLFKDEAPSAITCYNDACAIGVMSEVKRLGFSVPEDVSITGCDDSKAARIKYINLTTVAQDSKDLAEVALETTLKLISGETPASVEYKSPPTLIQRLTTGPFGDLQNK